MDFAAAHRDEIIAYIKNKFGEDRVAQMVTFSRLQGRSALKEVLRVHSACSFEEMNKITINIPDEAAISDKLQEMKDADKDAGGDGEASIIEWALENHVEDLKQWAYYDEEGNIQGPFAKYFEQAIRIEGTKKSQGKHAAGIVLSQFPLADVCPMVYDKTTQQPVCGFEMNDLEAMGHVKFDILSVSALDKMHGIMNLLKTGKLREVDNYFTKTTLSR
jgi:DNA polymerase-3 subunit alpha